VKLGKWAEVMEMMNAPLPEGAWSSRQAYERARDRLEQAVALEPSNAEYHLALGQLSGIAGNADGMDRSFERAVSFAPRNSPLRYVIAQEYLLAGRHESAARHARILAEQDDSYRIADSARKRILAERDLPAYRLHLQRSYLYRSLEILWRTGRQDQAELRMLCDGDTGAREVVRLFLEEKGLEE
jgi:tetratricopeptide (TPR) repeat protein